MEVLSSPIIFRFEFNAASTFDHDVVLGSNNVPYGVHSRLGYCIPVVLYSNTETVGFLCLSDVSPSLWGLPQ